MIHPTCGEVLATIKTGFAEQIVPHLHDTEARSAAATITHLLRHVELRIAAEGQVLLDDVARLRDLLLRLASWFDAVGVGDPAQLREAAARQLEDGVYPSLDRLGALALDLRRALVAGQEHLHRMKPERGDDPQYAALRQAVRDYIAQQLADEAKLIEPAFLGQGPRR